jgi:hypothetical protein
LPLHCLPWVSRYVPCVAFHLPRIEEIKVSHPPSVGITAQPAGHRAIVGFGHGRPACGALAPRRLARSFGGAQRPRAASLPRATETCWRKKNCMHFLERSSTVVKQLSTRRGRGDCAAVWLTG